MTPNKVVDNVRPKVRNLLDNNWDNSNLPTSSKPDISTGSFDESNDREQVCVESRNSSGPGTESGYDIMTPDGPGSSTSTIVRIVAYAQRTTKFDDNNVNPKDFVQDAISEADRIIRNNYDQMADFDTVGSDTYNDAVDTGRSPVLYQASIEFIGRYRKTP